MTTPEIELLTRLYVDEAMTISQVAAHLGVAAQTVHNRLVAARIPRRPSPSTPRGDVRDEEIRRLYVPQQRSAVEIAALLGCGTSTVYGRLDRMGIPRRSTSGSRSVRPSDDELRRLYQVDGQSLRQIAQRFRVTPPAVLGWVRAAGIERRPPGAAAAVDVDVDDLVALYLGGCSGPELARRCSCSPATIYRRLDAAGVERRQPTPAVDRTCLTDALAQGLSATGIAAQLDVSVTAVCRALRRESLRTATQAARSRSRERLTALLAELQQGASSH